MRGRTRAFCSSPQPRHRASADTWSLNSAVRAPEGWGLDASFEICTARAPPRRTRAFCSQQASSSPGSCGACFALGSARSRADKRSASVSTRRVAGLQRATFGTRRVNVGSVPISCYGIHLKSRRQTLGKHLVNRRGTEGEQKGNRKGTERALRGQHPRPQGTSP